MLQLYINLYENEGINKASSRCQKVKKQTNGLLLTIIIKSIGRIINIFD